MSELWEFGSLLSIHFLTNCLSYFILCSTEGEQGCLSLVLVYCMGFDVRDVFGVSLVAFCGLGFAGCAGMRGGV